MAFLISEFLIVQQDSASAHRACETFNLLRRETPAFISPDFGRLTTPITIQLTTKSGASASLDKSAQNVDDLRQRLIDVWTGIQQSVIYNAIEWHTGTGVSIPAFRPYEDILNTHCNSLNSKSFFAIVWLILLKFIVNQFQIVSDCL